MSDIVLGDEYRDRVTGWRGFATSRCCYLQDSPTVRLERLGQNGEVEEATFAEGRLEPVDAEKGAGFR